jgi:protein-S-isoprenylcysteine O-methyltransferase Ste14
MLLNTILSIFLLYTGFIGIFLFLPAGSLRYWEGWAYSVALLIPMIITVSYLLIRDPALLERRMRLREKEEKQKVIVRLFRLPFLLGFIIPGLDHRFGWSVIPVEHILISNLMVLTRYFFVFLVFRENSYASRIVEVEKDQKVISTGPYSVVRHLMYTGTILMFCFSSFALGSWYGMIVFAFLPLVLIFRILNEEKVLKERLPGYAEYCKKVRYRLLPFIW